MDPRLRLFEIQRIARRDLHRWLARHFRTADGRADAAYLGLEAARPFEVHRVRFGSRVGPDGDVDMQLLATVLQERPVPADAKDPRGPRMTFEGGATIVADLRRRQIRYCIRKSVSSERRLARQQEFALERRESLRAIYFGEDVEGTKEPFAALHRGL
jgi:hypothetical protein